MCSTLSDRKNEILGTIEYDIIPLSRDYRKRERTIKQQTSGMGKVLGEVNCENSLVSEEVQKINTKNFGAIGTTYLQI